MATLLIKFDPPLQSWGTKWNLREDHNTDFYPSKSGVIGMIASALGRRRDEDISDLARLKFGVRIDKRGTIIDDFQVSEVQSKKKGEQKKVISHRKYLSDACFTCGIEADEETLKVIENALIHPANALFAGRRNCPVTADLVQGIEQKSLLEALSDGKGEEGERKHIILDAETLGMAVKDVPVSFSPHHRRYAYRSVEVRR